MTRGAADLGESTVDICRGNLRRNSNPSVIFDGIDCDDLDACVARELDESYQEVESNFWMRQISEQQAIEATAVYPSFL